MKSLECTAVSAMLEKPLTDKVILDIQYKPSLTVDRPAREKFIENTSTQVCCQGNSNPPMDQIIWKGNVNYSVGNNTSSCLTYSPIHRTNTQIYTCIASNGIGISESHIYLKILYPPVVSVSYTITGQTINLHCHPRGEPNNYTFAKWYYRSEFDETMCKIEGTQTGKLTIIAQSNKTLLEQVGIYVCKVSNGIIARNGTLYQEGAVNVQFEAPPIFISTNKRVQFGQYKCDLNITVVLYSKLDIILLKISNDNRVLHPRITKGRPHTHDIFHGFKLKVHEITIVFHLGLATEEEFVNYTIDACNIKGCNSYTVYLRSGNRPEPPNNITVVQYENHMIVSQIPGFNGGSNQFFFIQHRNADVEWWKTTGPVKDSFENEFKYTIYELVSNKQYFVCMFSRNVIGESEKKQVFQKLEILSMN
ncbi:uncharacterized protein LOC127736593 [Mytilus californianus]|uniref:uncharacterized protein LOC127736593 n=1 Tax=Mytilus californianus TaxID=6549 RepID=UPI002246CC2A|nr:uncharacterized protein LOC127736593 [Mytilus californianus]